MIILKQSTAATVKVGPFVDDTDGKTAKTALSIAQADIRLSKNGADIIQSNNVAGATHDENGYYDIPLDTTDTNTLGRLKIMVSKSGALPVFADCVVWAANVFDSLIGGSDYLQTDAVQIEGSDATDQINAEVDSALNTAIPGSPTANSINERVKALDEIMEDGGTLNTLIGQIATDVTAILLDTGTTLDAAVAAVKAVVDAILLDVEADSYINTATTPWQLIIHKKGDTGTVYFKKNLKDTTGANLTAASTVVGQQVHTA